jgi:hypothetical protein
VYTELTKTLYHGSDTHIAEVDPIKFKRFKDFGLGFYMTTSLEQATKFAKLTAKKNGTHSMYISMFEAQDISPPLTVTKFAEPSIEWLDYVVGNRYQKKSVDTSTADIIIGPVADDDVGTVVSAYIGGIYGDITSFAVKQQVIKYLETTKYHNQVVFKTNLALSRLVYKGVSDIV